MARKGLKVAIYDPSGQGGITHYTFQLAEGLANAGCQVTVITSESYELKELKRSFAVWYLFKASRLKSWISPLFSSGTNPVQARSSARDMRRDPDEGLTGWLEGQLKSLRCALALCKAVLWLLLSGTHVVHVQWLIDRRADLLFVRTLRLLGFKIVYTVHDVLPHDQYTVRNRTFFEALYQYPDKLILHSENNRREMLELFTVDPEKLCVIPHGSHGLLLDQSGTSPSAARSRLGIPTDRRVILFFGVIRRYKGLEYLLEAFETIKSRCDNVLLLIAGKIYEGDQTAYRHYSTLLAEYSGHDDVRFVHEYVPFDQVACYFAAADLVVLPYLTASQSGVLLSAYAAGKPVIATDAGGLGEVVRHGHSGFVVPPRDASAIAEAAVTLLDSPVVRERFGREARRLAATSYSWSGIAVRTLNLYDSLGVTDGAVTTRGATVD